MACCRKQTPPRDDRELPKRVDRDQRQLASTFVPLAGALGDDAGHGSAFATLFAGLGAGLTPPTLRAQHVCMQV